MIQGAIEPGEVYEGLVGPAREVVSIWPDEVMGEDWVTYRTVGDHRHRKCTVRRFVAWATCEVTSDPRLLGRKPFAFASNGSGPTDLRKAKIEAIPDRFAAVS